MHNVRDLGGVPVSDGVTAYGVVLRGETPVNLTPLGAQQLRARGVHRVLDLREPEERRADGDGCWSRHTRGATRCASTYRSPGPRSRATRSDACTRPTPSPTATAYLHNGSFRLAQALARNAWSSSALYVHCAVGKDRTGVVSALLLKLAGAHDDVVIDDHMLTAGRLRPVLLRLGARPAYAHLRDPDWAAQAPSADAMRLFLDHLRSQGRARAWMLHHDTDGETVDLLSARLRGEQLASRSTG